MDDIREERKAALEAATTVPLPLTGEQVKLAIVLTPKLDQKRPNPRDPSGVIILVVLILFVAWVGFEMFVHTSM